MLNVDAAAPSHDLMQVFNRKSNNLNDETVLTVLARCAGLARVTVCYGCSLNFKRNGQGLLPPSNFIIVKKLRREYYNQRMKCLAAPSNAYFHYFFLVIIRFINPLNVFSLHIWHLMLHV